MEQGTEGRGCLRPREKSLGVVVVENGQEQPGGPPAGPDREKVRLGQAKRACPGRIGGRESNLVGPPAGPDQVAHGQ